MKLITMSLDKIVPYNNNPRKNDDAVEAVADSIKQCTYVQPIIVDENSIILAGHTRLKALKLLGYKECQVLIYDGLTEEQKKKFRYLDNKTGEAALWDLSKLEEELGAADLSFLDFFNMTIKEENTTKPLDDYTGAIEYDLEEFEEEAFRYECPECGFLFN